MSDAYPHVLDPVAARYASWLSLPGAATADVSDEDPADVLLMPMVLRLERGEPPRRSAMLAAAAASAVAVCLDERSAPGGEWHADVGGWTAGRIRKVARRARGSHWAAAQQLPGRTVEIGGAQVRSFVPLRVSETPKELSRLQISGSEVEPDEPGPVPTGVPRLWLNPHVPMSAGKTAAQVGHATMIAAALLHAEGRTDELTAWTERGYPCAVRIPEPDAWRELLPGADPGRSWQERGIAAVRDAGFTEVDPGTVTVLAEWALG
ncbi:peptidyl-tRNA hydrolase [Saccharopolyspora sp. HNM0983]|uniref:peptidyl-tRNA hydrolase n=1 Tax=Saccharopolyspora montiporae TaxID=2781240 RepID=A0A929G2Q5_9PSEU|nr:aminoacyl-tRNA hydrolase [Saccharopolyspora sp. HNM0983]MBE9376058.1 peptidyl-tRNA hydrolase [Saccharopolyspora sp. HNM0983]